MGEDSASDLLSDQEKALQSSYNEYFRLASLRLAQVLADNGSTPTRISFLQVIGSRNTRRGFLQRVVSPVLAESPSKSLKSSLDELALAADKLARFGIYDEVTIDLDDRELISDGTNSIGATIRLKERSRLWARTGTDFGNQEGSAYASANLRNVLGGGESLEGSVSFGTRTKTSYEIKMSAPFMANPDTIVEVLAYGASKSNQYASHDENHQGLCMKLKHIGRYAIHEVGLSVINRHITNLHEGASLYVRRCAGISRKISLLHMMTRDQRDDYVLPTKGYRLRMTQELAGLLFGGDSSFLKLELDGSKHVPLTTDAKTTLNISSRSGIFLSTGPSLLCDRFQLGGPQSVRGFMHNGLGPRVGKDSIGGEIFLATGASLLTPVPRVPEHWPLRFHAFVNSGALATLNRSNLQSTLNELVRQPSVTAGVGLVFKHPIARVEMSFCLPLVARSTDRSRKGLQFGLGMEFL